MAPYQNATPLYYKYLVVHVHVLPLLCLQLVGVTGAGLYSDRSSLPVSRGALLKACTDY